MLKAPSFLNEEFESPLLTDHLDEPCILMPAVLT